MVKSVKGQDRYVMRPGLVIMIILGLSCCKKKQIPEGVLSQDDMVAVMSELYIAEQKISTLGVKRDSLTLIFDVMKEKVFAKAGVADSTFRKSLDYYMDHPQDMEIMYTSLVDSLNLREQRASALSGHPR